MASVALEQFVRGLTAATAGQIAGQMAGEQQQRQREAEDFQRALGAAQLGAQERGQQNALLTHELPNLDAASQAAAVGGMLNQPSAYAGLASHPYVQRHPELAAFFQPQRAPAATGAPGGFVGALAGQQIPAAAPAPAAGGRTFQAPGIGPLTIKGVDKAEAAKVLANLEATFGKMRDVPITDPNQAAQRDELFRQRGGISQIQTPEDLQRAQQLLNAAQSFQSVIGGPAAKNFQEGQLRSDAANFEQEFEKGNAGLSDSAFGATLPGWLQREESIRSSYGKRGYGGKGLASEKQTIGEIEQAQAAGDEETVARLGREVRGRLMSRTSPQQEMAAQRGVLALIGMMNPRNVTPDTVRQLYADAKIGYLVEGLPDEALKLGGSALEKTWQKDFEILSNPARWAKLPKDAQATILDEITGAAAQTGRKIKLPTSVVLQMSPLDQQKLALRQGELDIQGSKLEVAQARLLLDQRKFDWAKQHAGTGPNGRGSILTQNARVKQLHDDWMQKQKDFDAALRGNEMTLTDFDPEHDTPKNPLEGKLKGLYDKITASKKVLNAYLLKQGLDVNTGADVTPAPPPPARATPGMRTAAPTGRAPVAGPGVKPPVQAPASAVAEADKPYTITWGGRVYKHVTKRQFRDGLIKQGATPAEVNAILRTTFGGVTSGGAQSGR